MLNMDVLRKSENPYEEVRRRLAPLNMEKLINHINLCADCDTVSNNKNVCIGNPDANILIIMDNATRDNEVLSYFHNILNESNIDMDDIFCIPSVCCACERKVGNKFIYRPPTLQEQSNCKYFIDYAIKIVEPRLIIAMGQTPLTQFYSGIKETRLVEEIENNHKFNGIDTFITYAIRDVFYLMDEFTKNEGDNEALELCRRNAEACHQHIVNTFIDAKLFVDSLNNKK